ncbi:outer membrane beta-barrel protein [Arcticibacter eurypsychrophilus]|uniref:outer membrane beta-barrel protein n=1 Tax=Arcticibacter eurypsychrophilus TaxID=1434752 RepID=UPI00084D0BF4|nr:outer membrane beta-barrel protein [Arcticibacter eurypsychrophilus]
MKFFIFAFLFSLFFYTVNAQNLYSVKGSVSDTASNVKLLNASLSIMNSKDSTLAAFTRAKSDGSFSVDKLKAGKFFILLTYPGYADYVERFSLDSANRNKDFGAVKLILKANLLAEVLVKAKAVAVRIKGDTTEFNAGSFEIQPNSRVEDLIKQFPGIQVDKDGKITAQGEVVKKVLVDGEEFFGDDPTLVTKNIRADMVDKVQLYDKKSDQATFTGIDDGEKTKTLNIKLKEDKKSGYFGKVDIGAGSDEFYKGQGMLNVFKGKRKFSAYAIAGNDGTVGLGWEDAGKYGAGVQVSDNGGVYFSGGGSEYNGQGIPVARTGGLHYDVKWNQDKESLNTNFKGSYLNVDGTSNTQTQNNLPTGVINEISDRDFNNTTNRQKLDATYEIKLDTTSNLKIIVDGSLSDTESSERFNTSSSRGDESLINNSIRDNRNDGTEQTFFASAFYTKKLKKVGRTLSLFVSQNLRDNKTTGSLNSENNYFNSLSVLDSMQKIDQLKRNNSNSSSLNTNITYTEPFSKSFSVILNYGYILNNSAADRRSFNQSAAGEYNVLDSLYSNNFEVNESRNQVGAVFNYKKDKNTINFGTKASAVDFKQKDLYADKTYERNFINWNPQASYQYKFSQQKSFRVNYRGNTSQPSLNQLQPILQNDDPLNITVGNPDLKPSFRNGFDLQLNSYKILSEQYMYLYGSYSFTLNEIVSNTQTDLAGKNVYQYINLDNKRPSNFNLNVYYGQKISLGGLNVGIDLSTNGNTYYNYANAILNKTTSYNYSGGLRISKYKQKKYDFSVSVNPGYNVSESSLQKDINNNGLTFNTSGSFSVYLPLKFQISSDIRYEYREKTASFDEDFKRTLWNARVEKKFFKAESFKLAISGKDLLNQNRGFDRSAYNNRITQNSYTTIKRYFMFSAVWDFNKMGGSAGLKK